MYIYSVHVPNILTSGINLFSSSLFHSGTQERLRQQDHSGRDMIQHYGPEASADKLRISRGIETQRIAYLHTLDE